MKTPAGRLAAAILAASKATAALIGAPKPVRVVTHKPTPGEIALHTLRMQSFGLSSGVHPPQSYKPVRCVRGNKLETMEDGVYFYRVQSVDENKMFSSRHYALSVHGMEDPGAHIVILIKRYGDQPFELEDGGKRYTVITFEDMSMVDDTGEYHCSVALPQGAQD